MHTSFNTTTTLYYIQNFQHSFGVTFSLIGIACLLGLKTHVACFCLYKKTTATAFICSTIAVLYSFLRLFDHESSILTLAERDVEQLAAEPYKSFLVLSVIMRDHDDFSVRVLNGAHVDVAPRL